jgi:hypothetical protein
LHLSSAGEAKYAALFAGAQHAASLRNILADLGYPQSSTVIRCDNTCAIGIATDSIKQKRSKALLHVRQGQFTISYIKSADNIADYFTKNLDQIKHKVSCNSWPQTTQLSIIINNQRYKSKQCKRAPVHQRKTSFNKQRYINAKADNIEHQDYKGRQH